VQYSNAKVAQHVPSFSSQLLQSNMVVPTIPQKQAQKPLDYPTALSKGRALLSLMRSPSTSIPPAPFTFASITEWGYESRRYGAKVFLDDYTSLLHALGSDTYMRPHPYDGKGGDNMDITFRHTTSVSVGDITYPASNAYFCSVLNPRAGLFIAVNNMSPVAKMLLNNEVSGLEIPLPKLRHWSDIAFLQWSSLLLTPTNTPLRYVLRANVQNADTIAVISYILVYDASVKRYMPERAQRPRWPGKMFAVDSWDAQALLGRPNGSGVAWLVKQHGVELGCGDVQWVSVFFTNCEDWEKVNLLFVLGGEDREVGLVRGGCK
jgi:hypothetical protein